MVNEKEIAPQNEKPPISRKDIDQEVSQEELEAILKKVDKESTFRKLTGFDHWLVYWIAVAFSCFHIYTGLFGLLAAQLQRSIHLSFAFALVYLLYPLSTKKISNKLRWYNYLFAVFAVFVGLYMALNYTRIMEAGGEYTRIDYIVGFFGVLLTLEAARRVVGLPIVCIAGTFLLYSYLGPYFPGFLAHRGYSIERIVSHMYFTTEGILGIPLGVSATFIFLFILFGAFLEKTGIGKLFIDIADAIAGWASGGPAKVAVITSALEGTISGSSVANTVGSGSFTIPMMKKLGYRPEFAAAVEASASTGGQIMPPIMGAAAFLMAEFTNTPYIEIAKAAAIPACLYFLGIFIEVHFEAKRCGLKGMSREQLPKFGRVLRERGHLFVPLIAIIYVLMEGYTPTMAALVGLGLSVIAGMVRKATRMGPVDIVNALEAGARGALGVAIACATAGIIVGVVTLTGLGLKMANGLVELAGGHLILTLFFTMIASIILGMGAPTTANYVITSTIAAPALVMLGVPLLAAHLFVFYFGIVADITPPVALAAYAGSGIAKSDPFWTGVESTKLAVGAFIVPYIFVYNPAMVLIGTTPLLLLQNLITASCGMLGVGVAMIGFVFARMVWWERIWCAAAGLMLIDPGTLTDIIGLTMLTLGFLYQWSRRKKARTAEQAC
ncbi:MAG: Sialic acid TRAP transporter permease protein SiaT [Syntrophaceae bacterium PtaU1.Bin231]|nr:MAG: Sialic acid TRAP transporter permease protein SiaT [Syntrophaceae bacterium PtaU1.Bin231]